MNVCCGTGKRVEADGVAVGAGFISGFDSAAEAKELVRGNFAKVGVSDFGGLGLIPNEPPIRTGVGVLDVPCGYLAGIGVGGERAPCELCSERDAYANSGRNPPLIAGSTLLSSILDIRRLLWGVNRRVQEGHKAVDQSNCVLATLRSSCVPRPAARGGASRRSRRGRRRARGRGWRCRRAAFGVGVPGGGAQHGGVGGGQSGRVPLGPFLGREGRRRPRERDDEVLGKAERHAGDAGVGVGGRGQFAEHVEVDAAEAPPRRATACRRAAGSPSGASDSIGRNGEFGPGAGPPRDSVLGVNRQRSPPRLPTHPSSRR